jgi:dolichol kinase
LGARNRHEADVCAHQEEGESVENRTELERLVDSTRGPQIWRRLFHAGVGVSVAIGMSLLAPTRGELLVALGVAVVGGLAGDLLRLRYPDLNVLFFRTFRTLASPREAHGIASSTWYVLGLLLVAALFPLEVFVPAVLVLALADPAASYIGRRWGKRRLGTGSVEGVVVFVVVGAAVLLGWAPPANAILAALAAGLVEVAPWKLDDNLTIPLAVAAALTLLSGA